ncbi:MAG: hypothetical protein AB7G75_31650 [Candidatus Binatia bacterium]
MSGRPKTWTGYDNDEGHKVTMVWPKSLWRDIQRLALEENSSATALMIEAGELLLEARRKERERKSEKKK